MDTPEWPRWLTRHQLRRIRRMRAHHFEWAVRIEPSPRASVIYGHWAGALEQEINIALRATPAPSFVGIYHHNQGFWQGAREPAMVDADSWAMGNVDDVLDLAIWFARVRSCKPRG